MTDCYYTFPALYGHNKRREREDNYINTSLLEPARLANMSGKVQHAHNALVLYVCWQGEICCRSNRCGKKVEGQVIVRPFSLRRLFMLDQALGFWPLLSPPFSVIFRGPVG